MAQMFPSEYPHRDNVHNPEYLVFQTLRLLPENYRVYYSKKFKGAKRAKEECEIDFIIFDGSKSLICLEVKGGEIRYDGAEEAWYQNGKKMEKRPDVQSSTGMHAVLEFLGVDASDVNVGWALCFPQVDLPSGFIAPSGVPQEVIVDGAGLQSVIPSIEKLEAYYASRVKRSGADRHTAERIHKKLTRSIGFVNRIGVRLARDYDQIVDMTEQQMDVLYDLNANQRVMVNGVAGSGKTLIATEFAKRLEEDGQSVLLLFYNRALANSVRRSFDRDSSVNVTTFHSFARKAVTDVMPEWWSEQDTKSEEFWDLVVPIELLEVIDNVQNRYDAIIVDEGQDFKSEWYETLEHVLKERDSGRFVVFYDAKQDIFDRWSDLPWDANTVTTQRLSRNCRNTRSIINYVNERTAADMKVFTASPDGVDVIEESHSNQQASLRSLEAHVRELIRGGVEPSKIMLLLSTPRGESTIANVDKLGGVKIEWMGKSYRDRSRSIRFASIKLFKGLESDVVFILDADSTSSHKFYTEATRARVKLVVLAVNSED